MNFIFISLLHLFFSFFFFFFFFISSQPQPSNTMGPSKSKIRCRCGKKSTEWVSFTEKNPGLRFVKCSNRTRSCGFWEWSDAPISPVVRSVMEVRAKKYAEKKVKLLIAMVVCCLVCIFMLLSKDKVADLNVINGIVEL